MMTTLVHSTSPATVFIHESERAHGAYLLWTTTVGFPFWLSRFGGRRALLLLLTTPFIERTYGPFCFTFNAALIFRYDDCNDGMCVLYK
jgi:hypothetical protein